MEDGEDSGQSAEEAYSPHRSNLQRQRHGEGWTDALEYTVRFLCGVEEVEIQMCAADM